VNQKASVQDVAEIIDRKLQVLNEYKRDIEDVNMRCQEVRVGLGSFVVPTGSGNTSSSGL